MAYVDFISDLHNSTKRDYVKRVLEHPKAESPSGYEIRKDYWDGERRYGYGGYNTMAGGVLSPENCRPLQVEERGSSIGRWLRKGSLLYEFNSGHPGAKVAGLDISTYAVENAKEEVRKNIKSEMQRIFHTKTNHSTL